MTIGRRTKLRLVAVLALIVCCGIALYFKREVLSSPLQRMGQVRQGDMVIVGIDSMVVTGIVLSVTERFDDKLGTYSCYRIDFGELDNGEHDIQTIPFHFVEKIQSSKASP